MNKNTLLLLLAVLATASLVQAQITPHAAISDMGRGINLGNTLEPPFESAWNNGPAQEYYFDDYVAQGFSTVRIPVRWDEHTADAPPFAIDAAWMDRVEQVVDWALARDLWVIINTHHEEWIKQDYGNPTLRDRFDAIWVQIAERFKDKPEKLVMEIINEPFGMTRQEVDDLNARILPIIRADNPTRLVVYSGWNFSGPDELIGAAVPDDPFIIGYFHAYNPWQFAGLAERSWGTDQDRMEVSRMFQRVADWSADTGVPVMISEFGAIRENAFNARMAFYAAYVEASVKHNFAFQVWDDGGMFQVYKREARDWFIEKDILLHAHPDGPTKMTAEVVDDSLIVLGWENRTNGNLRIIVERRLREGAFAPIAELPADANRYVDTLAAGGTWYQYRVIAPFGRGADRWGYPVEVFAPPTQRSPFNGTPFPIPGTIEAEDFDNGGEGLTYHDTDPQNIPNAYRTDVGVDIEPRDDGGFHVAYIASGEWLEYTIDVQEGGLYDVTTYIASLEGGGRFRYAVGDNKTAIMVPPSTNSWQTLTTVNTTMTLAPGEQILRLELLTARPFNVDRFTFELLSPTANEPGEVPAPAFAVYPNPAPQVVQVEAPHAGFDRTVELYNVLGQQVRRIPLAAAPNQRLFIGDLPPGLYLMRLMADGRMVAQEMLVKK